MRKFAPIAMLMALLTSLLIGGASAAQASAAQKGEFDCNQVVGVNVVSCNEVKVGDITVKINGNRILNDNEISILENNLNNADIDVLNVSVEDIEVIEDVVIKTYKSFNIIITDNDVTVCIVSGVCV